MKIKLSGLLLVLVIVALIAYALYPELGESLGMRDEMFEPVYVKLVLTIMSVSLLIGYIIGFMFHVFRPPLKDWTEGGFMRKFGTCHLLLSLIGSTIALITGYIGFNELFIWLLALSLVGTYIAGLISGIRSELVESK